MDVTRFTLHPEVFHTVEKLRSGWKDRVVSDVVDGEGHQYVDLVMEGGGVLGIALLGYTYALEQVGIRFMSIAGTSAGSITALLLAGADEKRHARSESLVVELANQDFRDFIDGDRDARDFVQAMLDRPGRLRLGTKALQVLDNLDDDLGLNPGQAFYEWIRALLAARGVRTSAELVARVQAPPPGLRRRDGTPITGERARGRLAIIAAEVSTETKVEFPRMAPLFWEDPDAVCPADFVRASMSIPFFFQPFRVPGIPMRGAETLRLWKELAGYEEAVPETCYFIDGGVMSNFPIDVFHRPFAVPASPTFGAKLGRDRRFAEIRGPGHLLGAIFNSARHCLDYDFITRNPDYRQLVTCIDTKQHDWLDFSLSEDDKVDLFACGVRAAADFLRGFDWEEYKHTRAHLMEAYAAAAQQRQRQKQADEERAVPAPAESGAQRPPPARSAGATPTPPPAA